VRLSHLLSRCRSRDEGRRHAGDGCRSALRGGCRLHGEGTSMRLPRRRRLLGHGNLREPAEGFSLLGDSRRVWVRMRRSHRLLVGGVPAGAPRRLRPCGDFAHRRLSVAQLRMVPLGSLTRNGLPIHIPMPANLVLRGRREYVEFHNRAGPETTSWR
jgi:hypothetical protein